MAAVAAARETGRCGEPAVRHRATAVLLEGAVVLAALELKLVLVALLEVAAEVEVTSTGSAVLLTWALQEEKEDFSLTALETQEVPLLLTSTRTEETHQLSSKGSLAAVEAAVAAVENKEEPGRTVAAVPAAVIKGQAVQVEMATS